MAYSFQHEFADDTEALKFMMNDLRRVLSGAAKELGQFLLKWGFLYGDQEAMTKQLTRYLSAIAQSVLSTMVVERSKMEKERVNGN